VGLFFELTALASYALALFALQTVQFNIVSYLSARVTGPMYWPAVVFAGLTLVLLCAGALGTNSSGKTPLLWPLFTTLPVWWFAFSDSPPRFAVSLLMVLSGAWAAFRVGVRIHPLPGPQGSHAYALLAVLGAIVVLTVVHTRIQINFYEHFMLGHADFGHYTEELHNLLAGRGPRSDSFECTRFGLHFTPLIFVLAPGYWLWPSPYYLMVCGPLLLHAVALPVYLLARRLSGSALVALLFALAWLLLPSLSRMVYANTYGFQWTYFSMPLLALMVTTGVGSRAPGASIDSSNDPSSANREHREGSAQERQSTPRFGLSLLFAVLAMLCEETVTAVTFGWGLYLASFTPRRRMGWMLALVSLVYLVLCVKVLIPFFAAGARYERFDLFGQLGRSLPDLLAAPFTQPGLFFGRLVRREALYYVLVLLASMAVLPLRRWRMALAAVPALGMVLLLQNAEWLSVKFWHQAGLLPVLFLAGVSSLQEWAAGATGRMPASRQPGDLGMALGRKDSPEGVGRDRNLGPANLSLANRQRGLAFAALIAATMSHYFFGFSPLSKPYAVYAGDPRMQTEDARFTFIRRMKQTIPRDASVHATERLAAHFMGRRRLFTGGGERGADFVLIDRNDDWDSTSLPREAGRYAADPNYDVVASEAGIVVFRAKKVGDGI